MEPLKMANCNDRLAKSSEVKAAQWVKFSRILAETASTLPPVLLGYGYYSPQLSRG